MVRTYALQMHRVSWPRLCPGGKDVGERGVINAINNLVLRLNRSQGQSRFPEILFYHNEESCIFSSRIIHSDERAHLLRMTVELDLFFPPPRRRQGKTKCVIAKSPSSAIEAEARQNEERHSDVASCRHRCGGKAKRSGF